MVIVPKVHFRESSTPHPLGDAVSPKKLRAGKMDKDHVSSFHEYEWTSEHCIWSKDELESVKVTHRAPETFGDRFVLNLSKTLRWGFDLVAGFKFGKRTEKKYINRIIFLETVAAIPG